MNVLVLADTHIPDHAPALPVALLPHLEWAELILHGGDATSTDVLTELEAYAPVHAVLGNIDGWDVRAAGVPGAAAAEPGRRGGGDGARRRAAPGP